MTNTSAVYAISDKKILVKFEKYKTRTELWGGLPTELEYHLSLSCYD